MPELLERVPAFAMLAQIQTFHLIHILNADSDREVDDLQDDPCGDE